VKRIDGMNRIFGINRHYKRRGTKGLWFTQASHQIPSIRFAKKPSNRQGSPDLDRSVECRFPEFKKGRTLARPAFLSLEMKDYS
jgi:hypothetical protein